MQDLNDFSSLLKNPKINEILQQMTKKNNTRRPRFNKNSEKRYIGKKGKENADAPVAEEAPKEEAPVEAKEEVTEEAK